MRRALGRKPPAGGVAAAVPYDDVDFEQRDFALDAAWPIGHDEIKPWYQPAVGFLGVARGTSRPRLRRMATPNSIGWSAGRPRST
ncbi:hypothetical protein ACRAWD_22085 [Caulobacter segnis]